MIYYHTAQRLAGRFGTISSLRLIFFTEKAAARSTLSRFSGTISRSLTLMPKRIPGINELEDAGGTQILLSMNEALFGSEPASPKRKFSHDIVANLGRILGFGGVFHDTVNNVEAGKDLVW